MPNLVIASSRGHLTNRYREHRSYLSSFSIIRDCGHRYRSVRVLYPFCDIRGEQSTGLIRGLNPCLSLQPAARPAGYVPRLLRWPLISDQCPLGVTPECNDFKMQCEPWEMCIGELFPHLRGAHPGVLLSPGSLLLDVKRA
jgi:hypothetical protein